MCSVENAARVVEAHAPSLPRLDDLRAALLYASLPAEAAAVVLHAAHRAPVARMARRGAAGAAVRGDQPVLAALHHATSSSLRIVCMAGHIGLENFRDAARRLASFAFVAATFHVAAPFAAMSTARALHGSVFGLVRLVADDATSAKCR